MPFLAVHVRKSRLPSQGRGGPATFQNSTRPGPFRAAHYSVLREAIRHHYAVVADLRPILGRRGPLVA